MTSLSQANIRAMRPALRLASLRSAADPRSFDLILPVLRLAVDGAKEKVDSLSFIGHQYASRGRFAEADGIFMEAVRAAGDDQTRAAENAVFAALYGSIGGDLELAKKWTAIYE